MASCIGDQWTRDPDVVRLLPDSHCQRHRVRGQTCEGIAEEEDACGLIRDEARLSFRRCWLMSHFRRQGVHENMVDKSCPRQSSRSTANSTTCVLRALLCITLHSRLVHDSERTYSFVYDNSRVSWMQCGWKLRTCVRTIQTQLRRCRICADQHFTMRRALHCNSRRCWPSDLREGSRNASVQGRRLAAQFARYVPDNEPLVRDSARPIRWDPQFQ